MRRVGEVSTSSRARGSVEKVMALPHTDHAGAPAGLWMAISRGFQTRFASFVLRRLGDALLTPP